MPDRTTPPDIYDVSNLKLPSYELVKLDNGIPVYVIEMGTQEVMKLEVIFHAGRPYEAKKLVARATSYLLKEGTTKFSSAQIAEEIDFYGATLSAPINLDTSAISFYSLTKHLGALLPLLEEILTCPSFPANELQTFVDNSIQTLQVETAKNDIQAYRTITELFFGQKHPYGYNSKKEMYQALTRTDLAKHFKAHYHSGNCQIVLSGKLRKDTLELLNHHLGKNIPTGTPSLANIPTVNALPQQLKIYRPNSLQSAIRIGRRFPTKHHPDYQGLYILNTLLGGYFGSRLMTNIREDKGYTYNIFSSVDALQRDACFYIGTEVGNDFIEPTIEEIYKEMARLQNELVAPKELSMLKNYLLGNLLSMIDGPFSVANIIKTIVVEQLSTDDFQNLVHLIKNIDGETLQSLAQQYLNRAEMWEVIVGEVK